MSNSLLPPTRPFATGSRSSFSTSTSMSASASTSDMVPPPSAPPSSTAPMGPQQTMLRTKKRRQGRGRSMMVKVFYSLSSPRFNPPGPTSSAAPSPLPTPTDQQPPTASTSSHPSPFLDTSIFDSNSLPTPPAPSPSPIPDSQPTHTYTCLARLSAPVFVTLLGSAGNEDAKNGKKRKRKDARTKTEYGKVTLKTCLSAICISRPEFVSDPTKDYAVSAVDPYESSLTSPLDLQPGQGLMEGKGMLSWNLAEKREGTTWVCGKVAVSEKSRGKRRRKEEGESEEDSESEESEQEEEVMETLEVFLQLVERPSFTQSQFLDSLRNFANPAPSSEFDLQRRPLSRSNSFMQIQQPLPVPVPIDPVPDPVKKPQLQDPKVLGLLAQLLPTLTKGGGQGQNEAIQTIAKFLGAQELVPSVPSPEAEEEQSGGGGDAIVTKPGKPRKDFPFKPMVKEKDDGSNLNPDEPKRGCSNCKRKKSSVWREAKKESGAKVSVCNACGIYFNKNGIHRTKENSPSKPIATTSATDTATAAHPSSTSGRPLGPRLTAACEADLYSKKKAKKTSRAGTILPPSPSKLVGPHRSPAAIFRHAAAPYALTSPGGRSPRSRLRGVMANATSPVRKSGHGGSTKLRSGYESDGEERMGNGPSGSGMIDFAAMFGGNQSPSPSRRPQSQQSLGPPSYLLTASPGTALKRILNDTNVDLGSFGLEEAQEQEREREQEQEEEQDINFYIHASPEEKENEKPGDHSAGDGAPDLNLLGGHLHATTDAANTDFDSILSSLRRDFSNRLSSNALTAPSSPASSSPCVQPRTSSATPGQKGKAPASCGRPAPSILNSFMDDIIPALALNRPDGDTPASDSDAWTPASANGNGGDGDQTMRLDGQEGGSTSTSHQFDLAQLLQLQTARRFLPPHVLAANSDANEFDYGSLPPSSPPALPSEAFPTPSDFGSGITPDGITPDGEGYAESGDDSAMAGSQSGDMVQFDPQMLTTLSQLLGQVPGAGTVAGGGKVSLDRSTVAQLLRMISSNAPLQTLQPPTPRNVFKTTNAAASGSGSNSPSKNLAPNTNAGDDEDLTEFYQQLLSEGGFGDA